MKAIVSVLDGLQVFPIYYIVKHVSKSRTGATVAAVVAVVTPSDFKMISWGGYANVEGLVLLALLAYYVIKGKPVTVALVAARYYPHPSSFHVICCGAFSAVFSNHLVED